MCVARQCAQKGFRYSTIATSRRGAGGSGAGAAAGSGSGAGSQGLEDALFAELLQTSRDDQRSVRAAAQRVGLDMEAFDACLASGEMQERLDRNYRAMDNARIKGLPTLDIGRRRLMGEQSEAEILDALRAAARELE